MAERMFNTALVTCMGLDVMSATRSSIRQSAASRAALRDAQSDLAAARTEQVSVKQRLARAKAMRAASEARAKA